MWDSCKLFPKLCKAFCGQGNHLYRLKSDVSSQNRKRMKTSDFYLNGHEDNTISDQMDSFQVDSGNNYPDNNFQVENSYQCKIKCEGNKVYHKPGFCPDCNMKLVSLDRNHNQL